MRKNKTASRAAENKQQALRLRIKGLSFRAIGAEMGFTHTYAHKLVTAALTESREKTAILGDQLRELELQRLDMMYIECYTILKNSSKEMNKMIASDKLIKIMERRAKLTGLDNVVESLDDEIIDEQYI